jgi:hypothetical protein
MSEHNFEDELEERDDVVEESPDVQSNDGEPWAKTSSGNADEMVDE